MPVIDKNNSSIAVAVVGMGCIFPQSPDLKSYWRMLLHGTDAITEIPSSHWSATDYFHEDPKKPDHVYCKRGGFIPAVSFDPTEFGIPPTSLEATDTSQLLGLVTARKALEDYGYLNAENFDSQKTSVILGVTGTQELVIPLGARLGHPIWRRALINSKVDSETAEQVINEISDAYVGWQENSFPGLLGNVVAGRISNRLNLGGTNCVVDAACASSMSAIHLAVLELLCKRSDTVITGGVDMLNDIFMHMCFAKTGVLSPSGDIRPFSKDADGTILGEGVGIFVLKRLEDARRDQDRIYAVIRGLGSSSDGKSQSIYAPRAEGQLQALQTAYRQAEIDPSTVELLEAHGTGTRVGDLVEFQALNQLFGKDSRQENRCALGSVKSMIGHTKAAAGAAGLMKVVLALYNKVLPPTLKVDQPDPKLDIDKSPFYLNTEARPWFSRKDHPRRTGVSAFGFGGSNFHMVIEEYDQNKPQIAWDGSVEIAAFSAATRQQLSEHLEHLKTTAAQGAPFKKIALEAAGTRKDFSATNRHRLVIVLEQTADLPALLEHASELLESKGDQDAWHEHNIYYKNSNSPAKLAFMFPGQGSQYVNMGRDLVCCFPQAFEVLEKANQKYEAYGRLSDMIYPPPVFTADEKQLQQEALKSTDIAQPALGAVSLAMFRILDSFGLKPDAVCGHSFGELSALCAAGRIDADTLLELSITRGRLMADAGRQNNQDSGAMLAVKAPLDELDALIKTSLPEVVLANRNSPEQGVLSGSTQSIIKAEELCQQHGFKTIRLPVSAAFHSPLIKNAQKPFQKALKTIAMSPADIPVYSNTTGRPYPLDPDDAVELLGGHLLRPVDFAAEIENLFANGVRTYLEVGPKSVLTGLVKSILKNRDFQAIALDSSGGSRFGTADLARTLAHLAVQGHVVDLSRWEQPLPMARRQLMSIPLCGVNYRSQKPAESPSDDPKPSRGKAASEHPASSRSQDINFSQPHSRATYSHDKTTPETGPDNNNLNLKNTAAVSDQNQNTRSLKRTTMTKKTNNPHQQNAVIDALKVVQEGLKSMQALQKQTAEVHQKFLETQTQASLTLQNMMENTQRLTEAALGLTPSDSNFTAAVRPDNSLPDFAAKADLAVKTPEVQPLPDFHPVNAPDVLKSDFKPPIETDAKTPETVPPESQASRPRKELENVMLETVSHLTGYPVEMLALDMDIEADLGIDSIKRVEILSALEENMPGLPKVSPEIMGTLKTLGQIIEYLAEGAAGNSATPVHPESTNSSGLRQQALEQTMLETVSRLTGYPVEMLALDMDIEADLGIDSIKRVEILSALEENMPGLPKVSPEIMGTLKTLGQIIEYLSGSFQTDVFEKSTEPAETSLSEPATEHRRESTDQETAEILECSPESLASKIARRVVRVTPRAYQPGDRLALPPGRKVFITDDKTGLSQAIAAEFAAFDVTAEVLSDEHIKDILHNGQDPEPAAGLIIVAQPSTQDNTADQHQDFKLLKNAFLLARRMAPGLIDSAADSGAFLATVSRLDGAFGFKGQQVFDPVQGGLAGLVKTAAIEWNNVSCRAFDIDLNHETPQTMARTVAAELVQPDPSNPLEIGFDSDARYVLKLENSSYPQGDINLKGGDVVVITGGAKGITAEAACALANQVKPTLILIGRSPRPEPEPQWLSGIEEEAAVKKAVLENELSGVSATPVQLEKAYQAQMSNRQINRNLAKMRQSGATVVYYSADVSNEEKVKAIIDEVRSTYGPITAVIHGAGSLVDRLIIEKTIEQFDSVFEPKVKGLKALLDATRTDDLKHLVLFSSITARIGNNGQVDYAMANEVLNKVAQQEALARPDCKVTSINWGPWDGGMVCSALKRKFDRSGVELIPMDAGAMCMIYEMQGAKNAAVEVVVGANIIPARQSKPVESLPPAAETAVKTASRDKLALTFKREIDVENYPILQAHVLDGNPVVPFALIAEWLGHGALHENPGLELQGLDDMRIFQGIKLDREKKLIRLLAGKARKNGSAYEVDVEIRDGIQDNREVIHSRATAILTDRLQAPPAFDKSNTIGSKPYSKSIKEVYDKILFHGHDLHGIQKIIGYSPCGMVARIAAAPAPAKWMKEPIRSRWIADPLVLDSAFQMAIIWCFEERNVVCLPSYSASFRQYRDTFPSDGVIAVLEIKDVSDRKMKGDFTFLDAEDVVVARLIGYEAIMDASLSKAFKPRNAA